MKESLRLSVPTPCHEDWAKMTEVERGRHCGQCCKTVVDFTGMSDGEVMKFFKERGRGGGKRAGGVEGGGAAGNGRLAVESGVCGRFAADQLGRELAPAPVQRNGGKWWQFVLAGALVLGEAGRETSSRRTMGMIVMDSPRADTGRVGLDSAVMADTSAMVGVVVAAMGVDTTARVAPDSSKLMVDTTVPVVMGEIGPRVGYEDPVYIGDTDEIRLDSVEPAHIMGKMKADSMELRVDTTELPADTVVASNVVSRRTMGAVAMVKCDTIWGTRNATDSVVGKMVRSMVDTVVDLFRPAELVRVYPNPVVRGGVVKVAWKGVAGRYLVSMLSAGGAMVVEKEMTVAGKGQVDEWVVPNGLAAGIYFLRVAGMGKEGYTVKLVVQ
jgi:hypothetical protein